MVFIKAKRNGAVDFWRFIFSICIVLCHVVYLNSYDQWKFEGHFWFANFRIGVEYFFLVSGFLMAKHLEKLGTTSGGGSCGTITARFIGTKIKGFYGEYLFAFCLSFVVTNLVRGTYVFSFPGSFFELLLLQIPGMSSIELAIGGSWYLSAMIFSMLILFPLLYLKRQLFLSCIAPLVSLFLLGWLYKEEAQLGAALQWNGVISLGLVRATAEICLGCVSYQIVQSLKHLKPTKMVRILLAAVELAGYLGTLVISAFLAGKSDFFCLFLLFLAVTVTFSRKSGSQSVFSHDLCTKLGKYSLPLYLNHIVWARLLSTINLPLSFPQELAVYLTLSFVAALVCMNTVDFLKALFDKNAGKMKKLLIES